MSRVYKASDLVLHGVVALLVLAPEHRDQQGIGHFRACFRRAREQRKDQVYDYGEWLGVPYVVVEYVDGVGAAVDVGER